MKNLTALLLLLASSLAIAQAIPEKSKGQLLYLPIYSHIWFGDLDAKGKPGTLMVSALVSIRNVSPSGSIRVTSAQYYDTGGKKLKQYLGAPVTINPMGTHELYIPKSDSAGGSGANFLIAWQSDAPVNPPIVEAIHAEVLGTRSLAFATTARVIDAK